MESPEAVKEASCAATPAEEPAPASAAPAAQEDDDDDDDGMADIDFAALSEAQQLAGSGLADKPRERGPRVRGRNKEAKRQRKQKQREDDRNRVKQAGMKAPSLREALALAAKAEAGSVAGAVSGLAAASAAAASASAAPAASHASSASAAPPPLAEVLASSSSSSAPPAASAVNGARRIPNSVLYDDIFADITKRNAASVEAGSASSSSAAAPSASSSSSAAPAIPGLTDADAAAAAKRLAKDTVRRIRQAQSTASRTVFVTNLPFKAMEIDIRTWLEPYGTIKELKMARDKGTGKPLGYVHVQFESTEVADKVAEACDKHELMNRFVRVRRADKAVPGEKFQFELPQELQDEIKALMKEAYEGKNLSTIRDAWQKRHPGQKLDVCRWGFKNFSAAMKSLPGVQIEHHLEKKLTCLAFFDHSPAHQAFLTEKAEVEARGEKRALEGADSSPDAKRRRTFGSCGGCAVM